MTESVKINFINESDANVGTAVSDFNLHNWNKLRVLINLHHVTNRISWFTGLDVNCTVIKEKNIFISEISQHSGIVQDMKMEMNEK